MRNININTKAFNETARVLFYIHLRTCNLIVFANAQLNREVMLFQTFFFEIFDMKKTNV